jgi:AcrR family transcriptional regulator
MEQTMPPPMDATPGRRERKRLQLLDHITDTAFGLFEREGFDAVTMEAIARTADVAKATLYKHFPVKEAILVHRFHARLAATAPAVLAEAAALPTFAGRLRHFLAASARWSEANRAYLGPYLRHRFGTAHFQGEGEPSDRTRSGMARVFEVLVTEGQRAGELRVDLTPHRLAWSLEFLYLGALVHWLSQPAGELTGEFDRILDLFLVGAQAEQSQ